MSYDLMVFEKTKAPANKAEFMAWYKELTKWGEEHSYDDISVSSPALRNWYADMLKSFPAMNGPDAVSDEELDADEDLESRVSDYSVARDAIYVAFAWSQADNAYHTMRNLAKKHGVGFFDVSGKEGDIILPDGRKIV
jgi:hypothetical protein